MPEFEEFVAFRERHLLRPAFPPTGGDAHLAEDLVQEALGQVFLKWHRIPRLENPSGYAQTVLVNTFPSYRQRRSSGERVTGALPDSGVDDPDPTLRLTLLRALAELSPAGRAVLVLRFREDRGIEETSGCCGSATVRCAPGPGGRWCGCGRRPATTWTPWWDARLRFPLPRPPLPRSSLLAPRSPLPAPRSPLPAPRSGDDSQKAVPHRAH